MTAGCRAPQKKLQTPQELYDLIHAQYVHGDLAGSQAAADQAVARFAGKDPAWEWRFRFLEASIRGWQSKYDEVLSLLQNEPPASLPASEFAVQRHARRATALTRLGKQVDAEREAQEALRITAETHSFFRPEACLAAVVVDLDMNKLGEAAALAQEGRAAAHARSDTFLEANMLTNQSVVALRQEHYDEAFEALNTAISLARSIDAKLLLENTLGNTGFAYHEIGDHERARADFAEASEEAAKIGNQLDVVRWLNNLGEEQWQLGDLEAAEASYQKALLLAKKVNSARETASVEMDLAWLLYARGHYDEAAKICAPALTAARETHNAATEVDLVTLKGWLALRRGDGKEAQSDFHEVDANPDALPSQRLDAQDAIAGLFGDSNQAQLAEVWYRKALETFEKQRASIGSEESRLPFFANAEGVNPHYAEFLSRHPQEEQALKLYFDHAEGIYPHYIEFLIHQHREAEALNLVDFGRARALQEGLRLKSANFSPGGGGTDFNPRALAAKLHAVLLEYSLGEKGSWLWAITPKQVKLIPLPARSEIAAKIASYRKAILNAEDVLAVRNSAGLSLYDTLIAPAQSMIPPKSRVIVLPDGILNELNFETLLVSKPEPHFWIDDVTVENANSLRLLNAFASHRATKKTTNLFLIGDPTPPAGEFNDLLNAPQEVTAVADHFPSDLRTVVTGAQAFPKAYAENHPERFTYIHFVAHGTASRLEPLDSAVVLSGNPGHPQDYRLNARDIIHTPLHADLVTISTCYGSGSREYAGEGLLGLSWSFLRAGAHSVVGALWEVSDLSTPQLMDKLYSGMQHGLAPDESLREAKLSLAHSQGTFRKPFYWAAFQVYAGS